MAGPVVVSSPGVIRTVPLVLALLLMSSLPLLPATEATGSRNVQDFMITGGVQPISEAHYSVWDPIFLETKVQSNASTPIGGRTIIAEICLGDHVSTASCPSTLFSKQTTVPTLNPGEEANIAFVDPFYAQEFTNQTYTVVFRFTTEDIRPADDRFALKFYLDEFFQDLIYVSNNLDSNEILNPEVDYQSTVTISTIGWPSEDQVDVGWTMEQVDVPMASSQFCTYVGSGFFENPMPPADPIPPYLSLDVFSINDVINATFNATSLSDGETYSLRWEVVTSGIVNESHSGSENWLSNGTDVSIQMDFSEMEDGLHCVRGELVIPRFLVTESSSTVPVSGSATSLVLNAPVYQFPNEGTYEITFWIQASEDPNPWNNVGEPVRIVVSDDVDIVIVGITPARGDEIVVPIGWENFLRFPYGEDSLKVQLRNDGDMPWNTTLNLEIFNISSGYSLVDGYPESCTMTIDPGEVVSCIFPLFQLGQFVVNVTTTTSTLSIDTDPANNYLETQITINRSSTGVYVAVPSTNGATFETGESIMFVAGLAPDSPLPVNYTWKIDYIEPIGFGRIINTTLPMGNHQITLHVRHSLMDSSDFDEVSSRHVRVLNRIQFTDLPLVTEGEAVSIEQMGFEVLGTAFPATVVHAEAVNIGKTPLRSFDFRLYPTAGESLNVDYVEMWGDISQLIPSSVSPASVVAMHVINGANGVLAPLSLDDSFVAYESNNSFYLRLNGVSSGSIMLVGDMAPVNVTPLNLRTQQLQGGELNLLWDAEGPIDDPYFGGWRVYKRVEFPFRWPYENLDDFESTVTQNFVVDLPGSQTEWKDPVALPEGVCASYILAAVDHQGLVDYTHGNVTGFKDVGNPDLQCGDSHAPDYEMQDIRAELSYVYDNSPGNETDYHSVTVTWTYPSIPDENEDGIPDETNVTWSLYRTQNLPQSVQFIEPILTGLWGEPLTSDSYTEVQSTGAGDTLAIGQTYHYILIPEDAVGNSDFLVRNDNTASIQVTDQFWNENPHLIPEVVTPDRNHENDWMNSFLEDASDQNFQTSSLVAIIIISINLIAVPMVINRNKKIRRRLQFLLEKSGNSSSLEGEDLEEFFD